MDLEKSPFFKEDSYSQEARCLYCGMLNVVGEHRINFALNPDRYQTFSWYTWCQACHKKVDLKETIYHLVKERLVKRKDCFQSPHKCTNNNLYVTLDSFQEKCSEHKDCWLYLCKKCFTMIHVSKMPLGVRERLDNRIKDKGDTKESTKKEENNVTIWEDAPSAENDRLLD